MKGIPLNQWLEKNEPEEGLIWRGGPKEQAELIVEHILPLLFPMDTEEYRLSHVSVVGSHRSKSVDLPVFAITVEFPVKVTFYFRGNFHDWAVSVNSEASLGIIPPISGLFDPSQKRYAGYCEGMKELGLVFDSYDKSHRQFTFGVQRNLDLVSFFARVALWLERIRVDFVRSII